MGACQSSNTSKRYKESEETVISNSIASNSSKRQANRPRLGSDMSESVHNNPKGRAANVDKFISEQLVSGPDSDNELPKDYKTSIHSVLRSYNIHTEVHKKQSDDHHNGHSDEKRNRRACHHQSMGSGGGLVESKFFDIIRSHIQDHGSYKIKSLESFIETHANLKVLKEHLNGFESMYIGQIKKTEGEGGSILAARHGFGVQVWSHGVSYEGNWCDDGFDGEGRLINREGEIYVGEFSRDHLLQNSYGIRVRGVKHGQGKEKLIDGSIYEGQFRTGYRSGQGKLRTLDGETYEGEFVKGRMHGRGTVQYRDGHKFEGEFAQGLKHGEGRMLYASGDSLEGTWRKGVIDGIGKFKAANGEVEIGYWEKGKRVIKQH